MAHKAPIWGPVRLLAVWDCCWHGATPCLQRWHLPWHAVATAEVFLAQAPGLQKSSRLCVTPGSGEGLEKLGCQHKGSRGKLLKAFLESWKQEMFNQSLRERKKKTANKKTNLKRKKKKTVYFWAARMFVKSLLRLLWCWVSAGCFIKDSWDTLLVH